jgi:hypothetical protein
LSHSREFGLRQLAPLFPISATAIHGNGRLFAVFGNLPLRIPALGVRARMHEAATRDESLLVVAIAEAIAHRVGRERYEMWLGKNAELRCVVGSPAELPTAATALPSLSLQVIAGEPFRLEYLKRQFRGEIAAAATEIRNEQRDGRFAGLSGSDPGQLQPESVVLCFCTE